jgi:hypothetical protein
MQNVKTFDLGFIGHKAEKLQTLFEGYTTEPNEYGHFLRFENTSSIGNKGVVCVATVFEDEEHFNEVLQTKLLFNI